MLKLRVIPCLDVKDGRVVKGVNFVSLRDAGDPVEQAAVYDAAGADELTFLDITASHENRDTIYDVVSRTAARIFLPLTVGGGVRSIGDMRKLLMVGADKCSMNSAAIARPALIAEAAEKFGSQCVVVAVDARAAGPGRWEVFTHGGRQATGLDAVAWCRQAASLGAGEILLTSMDRDGNWRRVRPRPAAGGVRHGPGAGGRVGRSGHAATFRGRRPGWGDGTAGGKRFPFWHVHRPPNRPSKSFAGRGPAGSTAARSGLRDSMAKKTTKSTRQDKDQVCRKNHRRPGAADRSRAGPAVVGRAGPPYPRTPAVSHSARLLSRGTAKVAQKFGEEAVECLIEAVAGNQAAVITESADVLYHPAGAVGGCRGGAERRLGGAGAAGGRVRHRPRRRRGRCRLRWSAERARSRDAKEHRSMTVSGPRPL